MKSVTTASVGCGSVFLFSLWLLVRAMSPHFQLILFFLIALGYECESRTGRRLNKFIRHYEPLYYDPTSLHNIHRRAVERSTHGKFSFSAFGKFHRLNLQPDKEIFTADAKILSGDGKPIPFEWDSVVRGKVEGRPYSDVYGVISKDDGFHGKILSGSENYYVDPSSWYFDEKQDFPSVMYKEEDLEYEHNFADIKHRVPVFAVPERVRRSLEEQDRSRSRRQSVSELDKNACTLSLYADNFFTKLYGGKTKAIFQLVKQVQAAQIIYTNEFNGTDYFYQKGITFRVKTIVAFNDSEKAPNNLPSQVKDSNVGIDTLLDLFSSIDHSGVCEAFLFTDRDFEGGILGLAWIGDPKGNALGGICDDFVDIGGGKKRSYNTGIVTLKLYGRFTPPRVSEITFAHELGHGFGSQHDPETEACAPGKPDGNFIMFDKATSGIEPNNDRFSPCSKDSIKENVNFKRNKKKDCFVNPKEPLCGNKIVEEGEECDCGNDNTCAEDCCIPANSDPSKKNPGQCFLRGGYVCSPSQGPCCSKMCKYEGPAVVCSVTNGCTKNTSCSGHSFSCDPPEPLKNGTLCDEGRRLCYSGQCSTSVCHRYGLVECSCEVESELCDLCCKEVGGACTSAKRLTQMATELRSLKLVPGTPCDNLNGYCDVFAICRRVDMEGPLLRLKQKFFTVEGLKETVKKYWWAIMLGTIAFCVLIGLFVFLCARYTPSSNPHKEAKKPAKTLPGRKKRNPQQRPGQQGMEMDPRV